jgi:hypothetical protein
MAVSLRPGQASSPSTGEDRDGGAETKPKITPTFPSPSRGRNESVCGLAFHPSVYRTRLAIFKGDTKDRKTELVTVVSVVQSFQTLIRWATAGRPYNFRVLCALCG